MRTEVFGLTTLTPITLLLLSSKFQGGHRSMGDPFLPFVLGQGSRPNKWTTHPNNTLFSEVQGSQKHPKQLEVLRP